MLRAVTGSTGGDTGGSHTITYAAADFAHTHGTSAAGTVPTTHTVNTLQNSSPGGTTQGAEAPLNHSSNGSHTHTINSDDFNHGHTVSFTPAYKDIVMASKD